MRHCVLVKFENSNALHLAHQDTKLLTFVLDTSYDTVLEAHAASIKYVNRFMQNMSLPPLSVELPLLIDDSDLDYVCTTVPNEWRLIVWHKYIESGYIFMTERCDKLFEVSVIPTYPTGCDVDESNVWTEKIIGNKCLIELDEIKEVKQNLKQRKSTKSNK